MRCITLYRVVETRDVTKREGTPERRTAALGEVRCRSACVTDAVRLPILISAEANSAGKQHLCRPASVGCPLSSVSSVQVVYTSTIHLFMSTIGTVTATRNVTPTGARAEFPVKSGLSDVMPESKLKFA